MNEIEETRGGRLGMNLAIVVRAYINGVVPANKRREYRRILIEDVKKYSLQPRKKGEPRHSGCIDELIDIGRIDPKVPDEMSKFVKETFNIAYNKRTSGNMLAAFLKYI